MQSSNEIPARLALCVVLLGSVNILTAQGPKQTAHLECTKYASFIHLTTKQLTKRAVYRQQPDSVLLKQAGVDAIITVTTFIDEKGHVVCAKVVDDANPLLVKVALEAAKAWRFRPLVREGSAVGMQGNLVFHIHR